MRSQAKSAAHDLHDERDALAMFCHLLDNVIRAPVDDIDQQGADVAQLAVGQRMQFTPFIHAPRHALTSTPPGRQIGPRATARADELLSLVLDRFDRAFTDYGAYGNKLKAEVLERRRIEKKLLETQSMLERHNENAREELRLQTAFLVDRTKEQEKLLSKLKSQQREQADFTYAVSHDLKSPTNTVLMLLKLFREETTDHGLDVSLINMAETTLERMQTMLDSLLDLAQTVDAEPVFTSIDMNDLVQDVIADINEAVRTTSTTLDIGPLPVINGVEFQIRHLIQNLLSNAVKFRKPDAPLHICIEDVSFDESAFACIQVKDNGIGIAPAYPEEIFGIFSRLHTQEDYPGSGLGLALCKRVVENHKGKITVMSRLDFGSTFEVTLRK